MNEEIYYISQNTDMQDVIQFQMCGITYPDKNYSIVRNKSEYACIEYVEKGTGTVSIDGQTFYPSEGDSYFLHAGCDQYYCSDKEEPWKKYFINLHGPLLENLIEGYKLKSLYYFPGLNIKEELYSIIAMAKQSDVNCTAQIINAINKIMMKMHINTKSKTGISKTAEDMKNFINTHMTSAFKIEDLCAFVSKSESQTIRIFKNAYGITPYAYMLNKKISIAKGMLLNTSLSVKQIAYNLNFADEYYFSNVFKNKTGMSPAKFRKQEKLKSDSFVG